MPAPDPGPPQAVGAPHAGRGRPRTLPQLQMPATRERGRVGAFVATGLHLLVALLFIVPLASHEGPIVPIEQGAGGAGPAGGGGGGNRGTGGDGERVKFVSVAPPPAPAPVIAPPAAVVPPIPIVPPEAKPAVTAPVAPSLPPVASADQTSTPSVVAGAGGGSGTDGTAGDGPGSGGGVGSGVGTGRGSGVGPGTGGGAQANFPPSPTEVFLPPLPAPGNVRGFRLIAEFDVDSTGRVLDFTFTPTRNGGYNRQLRDVLRNIRFRPGTRPDGTPLRMKAQLEYTFY